MNLKYCIQPNDNYFNIKELLKVKFQISTRCKCVRLIEPNAFFIFRFSFLCLPKKQVIL